MERNEPIDSKLPKDPMEPKESAELQEPIDKTEFFDHRLRTEFSEPTLRTELFLTMGSDYWWDLCSTGECRRHTKVKDVALTKSEGYERTRIAI